MMHKTLYIYLILPLLGSFWLSIWSCSNPSDSPNSEFSEVAPEMDTIPQNDSLIYAELQILDDSARAHLLQGEYNLAFPLLFKGFKYWHELERRKGDDAELRLEIGQWYYNTGYGYFYLSDGDNASFYLQMAAEYATEEDKEHQKLQGKIHNLLGFTYRNMGDADKASSHFEQALRMNIALYGSRDMQVAIVYNNMGYLYFDKQQYLKAADLFLKAFSIFEEIGFTQSMAIAAGNIANAYIEYPSKYCEAINYAKKGVALALQAERPTPQNIAYAYSMLVTIYGGAGKIEQALSTLQVEMAHLAGEEPNMNISYNPDFDLKTLRIENVIALTNKAELLRFRYEKTQDRQDLLLAFECIQYGFSLLDHVIATYEEAGSKLANIDMIFSLFEMAVDVSQKLYNLTHDEQYLHAAFEFCERSKAILLREELATQNDGKYLNISDDQKQLLNELKKKIREKQNKLEIGINPRDRADALWALINDKQQYAVLQTELSAQYPHTPLTYSTNILPAKHLQRMLPASSALIEYMIGDTIVYLFVITPDTMVLQELSIPNETLRKEIRTLRRSIHPDSLEIDNYVAVGHRLYQKLIAPAEDILKNIRQLYIISDGILNELPFKALLTQTVEEPAEFDEFKPHFLLQRYQISHGLSATLLLNGFSSSKAKATNDILSIAPYNIAVQKWYAPYNMSYGEAYSGVEQAKKRWWYGNSKSLIGMEATKEKVIQEIPHYRILDFAGTHGLVNAQSSQNSRIILAPPPKEKEELTDTTAFYLYLSEIYHQKLQAELVTLPICQTGQGIFQKGEGTISLARAFKYAGVPSIMMTIWPVMDQATGELNANFYKNLQAGMDKSTALQQAQLSYLEQSKSDFASPYFWAGIVLIGNDEPIEISSLFGSWKFLGAMTGLLILLIMLIGDIKLFIHLSKKHNENISL